MILAEYMKETEWNEEIILSVMNTNAIAILIYHCRNLRETANQLSGIILVTSVCYIQ